VLRLRKDLYIISGIYLLLFFRSSSSFQIRLSDLVVGVGSKFEAVALRSVSHTWPQK